MANIDNSNVLICTFCREVLGYVIANRTLEMNTDAAVTSTKHDDVVFQLISEFYDSVYQHREIYYIEGILDLFDCKLSDFGQSLTDRNIVLDVSRNDVDCVSSVGMSLLLAFCSSDSSVFRR